MGEVRTAVGTTLLRHQRWRGLGVCLGLATSVIAAAACFVDVDEGLIDEAARKRDARDAQSVSDGAGDAVGDAAAAIDGAFGDARTYQGLACGKTFCAPPGEVCCATTFGDPDIANGVCSTTSLCESGDWFACESARDCAAAGLGDLACCVVRDKGAFTKTTCAATCSVATDTLCDLGGRSCPAGTTCKPSAEFPSLFQCRVQ